MEGKICVVIAESEKWEENNHKVIVIMETQLLKLILEYKEMLVFLWVKFGDNSGFIWIMGGWLIRFGQNFKGLFGYFQHICNKNKIKVTLLQKKKKKKVMFSLSSCAEMCVLDRRTSFSKRNCMFCLLIHQGREIDEIMVKRWWNCGENGDGVLLNWRECSLQAQG